MTEFRRVVPKSRRPARPRASAAVCLAMVRAWGLGGLCAGCVLTVGPWSNGQRRTPTTFEVLGSLSAEVRESSGLAVSRTHRGILWTHNDSGDGPLLYAVALNGTLVARYEVVGAAAVDWEDVELATCPGGAGECLYVADTGDNEGRRPMVTVYVIPEPVRLGRAPDGPPLALQPLRTLHVRYPDGRHDVEALWVAPNGALELVTKGMVEPIHRYRFSPPPAGQDTVVARRVGPLPVPSQLGRWVTGAALSPSGQRVAVRTYTEILFFDLVRGDSLGPSGPPCWLGAREPQGEAIGFLNEDTLVLTSEAAGGEPGRIHRVRC